jgi:diacylglycerol kinase family enzyme
MKVTLIRNPGAGSKGPSKDDLVRLIRRAGHKVRHQSAKKKDWDGVLAKRCDLVAIAGGDGTVAKVVKKLHGQSVPVTILPTGTANNILRTLGPADVPIEELIAGWSTASRRKFDVGIIDGPWGSRPFVESVGVGLFASTMSKLDARRNIELNHVDHPEEKISAAIELLQERLDDCSIRRLTISLDGEDLSDEYVLVEVMNTRYVGPGLKLAPDARVDDGLFDVILLKKEDQTRLRAYLSSLLNGAPRAPALEARRAERVQMIWEGFGLQIDDESWPEHGSGFPLESAEIDIRLERHAVEFLVPVQNSA